MRPSSHWTFLTGLRDESSGGRSLEPYEPLSALAQGLRAAELGQPVWFHTTVGSPTEEINLYFGGNGETAFKKMLACLVIMAMPPAGMDEVLRSLSDAFDYYAAAPAGLLPERTQTSKPARALRKENRPGLILAG